MWWNHRARLIANSSSSLILLLRPLFVYVQLASEIQERTDSLTQLGTALKHDAGATCVCFCVGECLFFTVWSRNSVVLLSGLSFSRQVWVLTACGRRRSPSASATGSCIWSFCISDSPGRPYFFFCLRNTKCKAWEECQQLAALLSLFQAANRCVTQNAVRRETPLIRVVPT